MMYKGSIVHTPDNYQQQRNNILIISMIGFFLYPFLIPCLYFISLLWLEYCEYYEQTKCQFIDCWCIYVHSIHITILYTLMKSLTIHPLGLVPCLLHLIVNGRHKYWKFIWGFDCHHKTSSLNIISLIQLGDTKCSWKKGYAGYLKVLPW